MALGGNPRLADQAAWDWYKKQPWLVGTNFLPSTAANTTEFWQAESFDEPTIERELAIAQATGFNTCRVFTQYLVWKHDPEGFKKRFDRFLAIAQKHHISVVPTLFDDCSFGDPPVRQPYLGKQRDPIPGMIAPSWTPSPGLETVTDRKAWPDLQRYVKDTLSSFGKDPRVVFWDLYNEPGNSGMGNKSLPLVEATFAWAHQAGPTQPLTMGVWNDGLRKLNAMMLAQSDIITYHAYTNYESQRGDYPLQGVPAPGDLHGMDGPLAGQPVGHGFAAIQAGGGRLLQLGPGQRPHAMPVQLGLEARLAGAQDLVP